MAAMRIEDVIGQRVRESREQLGMTQQELGESLEPLLGKTWSRQAVWSAERGQRAFTAAELVSLTVILKTTPTRLMAPPLTVDEIELPGGKSVQARTAPNVDSVPQLTEMLELAKRFMLAAQHAAEANEAASTAASALASRRERYDDEDWVKLWAWR